VLSFLVPWSFSRKGIYKKEIEMIISEEKRKRLHEIIFEADTKEGKLFDLILMVAILLSLLTVILESIYEVRVRYESVLHGVEWFITILFSIEYIGRLIASLKPKKYIFSFYGMVDLLAILPTYISLFIAGGQFLVVVRSLRLLRIFRVLKLTRYITELNVVLLALKASSRKISVFLFIILTMTTILGTVMYMIEGGQNGFSSIPRSIYWAIVTLTTVGYGDISPVTALGQIVASLIMILGYGIIAVPTGLVTMELTKMNVPSNTKVCDHCHEGHHPDKAMFCHSCGQAL
jgi:voltage-gated potassium channel